MNERDTEPRRCLIPDDLYEERMEGVGVGHADFAWSEHYLGQAIEAHVGEIGKETWDMLGRLQRMHDDVDPKNWRLRLTELAMGRGLSALACGPMALIGHV